MGYKIRHRLHDFIEEFITEEHIRKQYENVRIRNQVNEFSSGFEEDMPQTRLSLSEYVEMLRVLASATEAIWIDSHGSVYNGNGAFFMVLSWEFPCKRDEIFARLDKEFLAVPFS